MSAFAPGASSSPTATFLFSARSSLASISGPASEFVPESKTTSWSPSAIAISTDFGSDSDKISISSCSTNASTDTGTTIGNCHGPFGRTSRKGAETTTVTTSSPFPQQRLPSPSWTMPSATTAATTGGGDGAIVKTRNRMEATTGDGVQTQLLDWNSTTTSLFNLDSQSQRSRRSQLDHHQPMLSARACEPQLVPGFDRDRVHDWNLKTHHGPWAHVWQDLPPPPSPHYDLDNEACRRPSTSKSHHFHFRWPKRNSSATQDDFLPLPAQGRISSESAMTIIGRRSSFDRDTLKGDMQGHDQEELQKEQQQQQQQQQQQERNQQQPGDITANMTKQEFEALPLTIQRKYFSSLERLRFAQLPPTNTSQPSFAVVSAPTRHTDTETSTSFTTTDLDSVTLSSLKKRRRRASRIVSEQAASRLTRRSSRRPSFYATLPDKIKRQHLTSEEQIVVARLRRHNIKLTSPNDTVRRSGRRASNVAIPESLYSPTLVPPRPQTMETHESRPWMPEAVQKGSDSFYDSFRWLEEDDELDLRLHLDDYHANLRQELPPPTKSRRPSFRRHLSITKVPFGRSSISSGRPGTTHATTPTSPAYPPSSSPLANPTVHVRRKSRALSLISPKQSPKDATTGSDPAAAHYQDPEARQKLKLYLASPLKFDEAVQYGFPSTEGAVKEMKTSEDDVIVPKMQEKPRTFLADDKSSIYSDEMSAAETDSPKTPHAFEKPAVRPLRVPIDSEGPDKPVDEGSVGAPSSREMTLRMTLTRPDLRANEDQIYGWQHKGPMASRKSTSNALRDEFDPVSCAREGNSKESFERQFAAMDQWQAQVNDRGVMKRFWHKVRRAP
ncbi:hypothetical protein D7B24_009010 [Verticillium nonalfalfae]|uniref:Mucin n=1 Tax=Verticillium nonalfalfae TaxID=1051616 RepID=A0A3M9Y4H0_9PEZI|nr:uncharacterized protein D7B24_009010 [Verticillium nonalfalfae]RNJ55065.1 hypothetical protein D7B24_009010 [Verticillium nonalfalfae]